MLTLLWNAVDYMYTAITTSGQESLLELSDYFTGTISSHNCPVSSSLKLYEEELRHFCQLCGTSVNLWTYHVLRYYTTVFSCSKKGKARAKPLQGLVECLRCVLAELQPPPSLLSSRHLLPSDPPHTIAQELCSPDFIRQLLAIPLPNHSSTTAFAVLFNATLHALTSLRNQPSSCGPFYNSAMLEYNIGEVANKVIQSPPSAQPPLPSPESLYRQELALLLERCGEECPLWRYHVLKYWSLVRCYPSPLSSSQVRRAVNMQGKSDLESAELMYRIICGE